MGFAEGRGEKYVSGTASRLLYTQLRLSKCGKSALYIALPDLLILRAKWRKIWPDFTFHEFETNWTFTSLENMTSQQRALFDHYTPLPSIPFLTLPQFAPAD